MNEVCQVQGLPVTLLLQCTGAVHTEGNDLSKLCDVMALPDGMPQ